jgi:LacI family transcriptional regulator
MSVDGYRDAYRMFDVPCPEHLILPGDLTFEFGKSAILDLMPRIVSQEVTALITLNHNIFKGVLQTFREHHIEYPKHISIICGENSELSELLNPSVTAVNVHSYDIGRKGAEMLLHYIEQPSSRHTVPSSMIETELIVRESCRRLV